MEKLLQLAEYITVVVDTVLVTVVVIGDIVVEAGS
jgi:hypothetical protein